MHVILVRWDQCSTSFPWNSMIYSRRSLHLKQSPLRPHCLKAAGCMLAHFCHVTLSASLPRKTLFLYKSLEPWKSYYFRALLNHTAIAVTVKPKVRPLTSFLLANSHNTSSKHPVLRTAKKYIWRTFSRPYRALDSEAQGESKCLHYWLEMLPQGNHFCLNNQVTLNVSESLTLTHSILFFLTLAEMPRTRADLGLDIWSALNLL